MIFQREHIRQCLQHLPRGYSFLVSLFSWWLFAMINLKCQHQESWEHMRKPSFSFKIEVSFLPDITEETWKKVILKDM